jgi:hypothetical protein
VCDAQADPAVFAFFRRPSDDTAKLIVQLNSLYVRHKASNLKAAVMLVAGMEARPWLEALHRSARLEIPLTVFTKGPADVAARVYQLNPEVENTFLVAVDRAVVANISGIAPEQFGRVAETTARVLAASNKAPPR